MYVCVRTYIRTYARMYVRMYACMYVCRYACMHVCKGTPSLAILSFSRKTVNPSFGAGPGLAVPV